MARVSFRDSAACFLIHVESQSSNSSKEDFHLRMFHYFARLYEKFRLPVYPIALFTFDQPEQEQDNCHTVSFPDLKVLEFNFVTIQLNRLNWRDFLKRENPVASALMAKMKIAPEERAQVKAECLRLLATLELNQEKMELISGFVGTYLRLNEEEEEQFEQALESMELKTKERVMQFFTDWEEKGIQKGQITKGQEDILRVLEVRFKDIPLKLRELMERIDNLERLGNLLTQAVTVASLEEFESLLIRQE
ncbi:MAG: flagellar assembly protein H [Symploca sp. SIO2E6]|nr:flagellar assembly protein H [Symploca sp. SIO2E6]